MRPNPDEKKDEKKKENTKNTGWIKVFDSIVGDDIINSERYATMPVHNVFRYITRKIKEDIKSAKK